MGTLFFIPFLIMMEGVDHTIPIRFFIDADSFPRDARALLSRIAIKRKITCFFVANRSIPLENSSFLHLVMVEQGKDRADSYILEHALPSDIVFTRDILFAENLAHASIFVLNHFGDVFTLENITERRSLRDFSLRAHEKGLVASPKASSYGPKDLAQLANSLDSLLSHMIKELRRSTQE